MADSKITALTALTAADPANDMIPIVDVSDTPPASGNTKRISINNILACSPSATLASATITGDLTVDTSTLKVDSANNAVGVGTASPTANTLTIGANRFIICSDSQSKFGDNGLINGAAADGNTQIQFFGSKSLFFNEGVSTRMTLNSTGLGVGKTPTVKLDIGGTGTQVARIQTSTSGDPTLTLEAAGADNCSILYDRTNGGMRFDISAITGAMRLSTTGNVGIGVTPSYNLHLGGVDPTLAINTTNQSISSVSKLLYRNKDGNGNTYSTAGVYCETAGNGGYGNLVFYSAFNNGLVERLRMDSLGNSIFTPSVTPPTLSTNGQLVFNMTSNTNLRFSYRGSDGVTRVANITLA